MPTASSTRALGVTVSGRLVWSQISSGKSAASSQMQRLVLQQHDRVAGQSSSPASWPMAAAPATISDARRVRGLLDRRRRLLIGHCALLSNSRVHIYKGVRPIDLEVVLINDDATTTRADFPGKP